MAAYRKKAANDRDALFGGLSNEGGGGGSSGGRGNSKRNTSSKPTSSMASNRPTAPPPAQAPPDAMARLRDMKNKKTKATRPGLQGEVRETKLKEAQEYKDKANKCMQKSFFSKPDPVAASTYYKRAADCYQQIGDLPREERLYRLESAACNEQIRAWASVASDYTRAADLLAQQYDRTGPDPTVADPGREAWSYHLKASHAWTQMNEKSKAAASQIKAAMALHSFSSSSSSSNLSKQALTAMEEAVEAHVPDVLNPYRRYRQTGASVFDNPDDTDANGKLSAETMALAREHMVTASYAHEPVQELVYMLVQDFREYPSALYAAGAASALLERDGHSTLSLSRMYLTETILFLALGDAVAAQEMFMQRHVQKTFYLSSRECQLAEELIRAILNQRSLEALDTVRSPTGSNKAALANLHPSLRQLTQELRVSGVARKPKPGDRTTTTSGGGRGGRGPPAPQGRGRGSSPPAGRGRGGAPGRGRGPPPPGSRTAAPPPAAAAVQDANLSELMTMKTGYEADIQDGEKLQSNDLAAELDNLDFGDDGDEDDDDDFDLR